LGFVNFRQVPRPVDSHAHPPKKISLGDLGALAVNPKFSAGFFEVTNDKFRLSGQRKIAALVANVLRLYG
jgi:hypothetical protein